MSKRQLVEIRVIQQHSLHGWYLSKISPLIVIHS